MARILGTTLMTGLVCGFAGGCGGSQRVEPADYTEAAALAYAQAERAMGRRDYEGARGRFGEVLQQYPYSEYAVLSELRIADCFFEERTWARAIEAYRRFARFHPSHEQVAWAEYRIAASYSRQMPGDFVLMPPSYERELRDARAAYDQWNAFLSRWGGTEWATEARVSRAEVRDRLASHELYVGRFYLHQGNAYAAAVRAEDLVSTYPDSTQVPDALHLLAHARIELGDVEAAIVVLTRLSEEFGETSAGRDAGAWLARWAP